MVPFLAGENGLFGFLGREQEGDNIDGNRLAGGIRLDLMAGGQNLGVLEHSRGHGIGMVVVGIGDEHIDMGTRHEEAGNADHFIGTKRDGAHAAGNSAGEADAGAGRSQLAIEDGLAGSQRIEHGAANHVVDLDEAAGERMGTLGQSIMERSSRRMTSPGSRERAAATYWLGGCTGTWEAWATLRLSQNVKRPEITRAATRASIMRRAIYQITFGTP